MGLERAIQVELKVGMEMTFGMETRSKRTFSLGFSFSFLIFIFVGLGLGFGLFIYLFALITEIGLRVLISRSMRASCQPRVLR
jgi:hypothetical protein